MASIEKICEFSGDYPGGIMYKYKRRNIQICPKYRDYFKKYVKDINDCVLFVFKPDMIFDDHQGVWCREDNYMLYVYPEELKGQVEGRYYNYARGDSLKHVLYNISELVGIEYHISYIDLTLNEFNEKVQDIPKFELLNFEILGEVIGHWNILQSYKYIS